jgi:DNA-binding response OmpR family regulator
MHTLLIIEDEEPLRVTLTDRLTLEGFRVQTAATGEEGLRQVEQQPPDLILCDIMMPGLDGYGVLRALQANERTAAIPFLFLTARADPTEVRAGMGLGADDYLCKPVATADLLAAIRSRLKKQEQQNERLAHEVETARLDVVQKLPHELLTPLSGLLSVGQLLEIANPEEPIPTVRELGRVVRLAAQRLHRTIRRYLLYAELAMASHHPEAQARLRGTACIAVSALTAALAEHLARQDARADDLQLDLREVEATVDPTHFGELVAQLVDNAFKFSTPGSVVQVHLSVLPTGDCLLVVRDQGRGMTPDQVRQVGAFRQFDNKLWAQPGTGLGLALVGQLAALYGGSFTLESEPGNGTKAAVRLPHARPGSPTTLARAADVQHQLTRIFGDR